MRHPAFLRGEYDTGFIERHKAELAQPAPDDETATLAAIASAAAAAAAARAGGLSATSDLDLSQTHPSPWRRRRDD
jgi:acetyl/propionyl-CoA carboxylase alpha subunit